MATTSLPRMDLEAEKKKNVRIAVGIGAAGTALFIVFYGVMFLVMVISPFALFSLAPFPDFPTDAVGFRGDLFVFSKTIDFQQATPEQELREVTMMRKFDEAELQEPREIEPFTAVAADADAIYFFHEEGYRTFDGLQWAEYTFSDIGKRPEGVVDNGRIWVLSMLEGDLSLVRIEGGGAVPIALPFKDEDLPTI